MSRPVRLQLSRKKDFRLHDHSRAVNGLYVVSVARPGQWGNPFAPGRETFGRTPIDIEGAVGMFRDMIADKELRSRLGYPTDLSWLRGRNLACWCAPEARWCHADVLLALANPEPAP